MKETQDKKLADYLYSLFDTRPEFISASIDQIENEYGSISTYAQQVLNLNSSKLSQIRDLFLTKA